MSKVHYQPNLAYVCGEDNGQIEDSLLGTLGSLFTLAYHPQKNSPQITPLPAAASGVTEIIIKQCSIYQQPFETLGSLRNEPLLTLRENSGIYRMRIDQSL